MRIHAKSHSHATVAAYSPTKYSAPLHEAIVTRLFDVVDHIERGERRRPLTLLRYDARPRSKRARTTGGGAYCGVLWATCACTKNVRSQGRSWVLDGAYADFREPLLPRTRLNTGQKEE